MGASSGGIIIQTNTEILNLKKTIEKVFGKDYVLEKSYCDTRKKECVYIAKTKKELIIINSHLVNDFFEVQPSKNSERILNLFPSSKFTMAFEQYDSGSTYSYSLIYDKVAKRRFRNISGETIIDFGELEKLEIDWKNSKTYKEDLGNDELDTIYKSPYGNQEHTEGELPFIFLTSIMFEKFGFDTWSMDNFVIEEAVFRKQTNKEILKIKNAKYKIYLLIIGLIIIASTFIIPKLFDYSDEENLIKTGIKTQAQIINFRSNRFMKNVDYFLTVKFNDIKGQEYLLEKKVSKKEYEAHRNNANINIYYEENQPRNFLIEDLE